MVADPVEWLAGIRCFIREGRVVASSPYISFGRPVWRPWGQGGEKADQTGPRGTLAAVQRGERAQQREGRDQEEDTKNEAHRFPHIGSVPVRRWDRNREAIVSTHGPNDSGADQRAEVKPVRGCLLDGSTIRSPWNERGLASAAM